MKARKSWPTRAARFCSTPAVPPGCPPTNSACSNSPATTRWITPPGGGHGTGPSPPDRPAWRHVYHAKCGRAPGWPRDVFLQPFHFDTTGFPQFGDPLPPRQPSPPARRKLPLTPQPLPLGCKTAHQTLAYSHQTGKKILINILIMRIGSAFFNPWASFRLPEPPADS